MKFNHKKENPLILYEKYKFEHHLSSADKLPKEIESAAKAVSAAKWITNTISIIILVSMICLSAVGIVTLVNPQMRMMFLQIVGI